MAVHPPVGLRIGDVARRSGLPVKTIRFYCDAGLLRPIARSGGGYRLFDDSVEPELTLIRTLRAMEIPLREIGAILEARRAGVCTCDSLQATLRHKVAEIQGRIDDLQGLRRELITLLGDWQACGGSRTPLEKVRAAIG